MPTAIQTEVYGKAAPRFNLSGQLLASHLVETSGSVSQGLAKRLLRYAQTTLDDAGFLEMVSGWEVTVYTLDADEPPADSSYNVSWKNEKDGVIEVVGIMTYRGWPTMDHGLDKRTEITLPQLMIIGPFASGVRAFLYDN
ncbi:MULTISPECIES: hypothetical protein [Halomonas]|uniref:hypothetical protein n=1 Tax=Halomonas TaxID=2745 RepID=UPI003CE83891